MKRRIRDLKSRCGPAVMLFLALTFGCTDPPAAPTPPIIAPAPPAVSVEIDPTMAQVGEVVTFTYRLSRALDDDLEFWTENTPPAVYAATFGTGETFESGPLTIRAGENAQVYSTGYLREIDIGDWAKRIMGERLPDGVTLGEPSSGTWTVAP